MSDSQLVSQNDPEPVSQSDHQLLSQDEHLLSGHEQLTGAISDAVSLRALSETTTIHEPSQENDNGRSHLRGSRRCWNWIASTRLGRNPWLLQSLSCLLSSTLLYCMISIALTFGDRPLTQWTNSMFSINALVSVLSTIMKGALMVPLAEVISQQKWSWFSQLGGRPFKDIERIDKVSRGTWGSFQWLFKTPSASLIISLGASLTIFTLAFDAFSQQFISIDIRIASDELGAAYVPWVYKRVVYDQVPWLGAMYNGLYSPSIEDLLVTCSSGNCTMPMISSVGVCGACHDVTHTMPEDWKQCNSYQCQYTGTYFHNDTDYENGTIWLDTNLTITHELDLIDPSECEDLPGLRNATSFAIGRGDDRLWKALKVHPDRRLFMEDDDIILEPSSDADAFMHSVEVIEVRLLGRDSGSGCRFSQDTATITQCGLWYCRQDFDTNVSMGLQSQTMREGPAAYSVNDSNVEWVIPGATNTSDLYVTDVGSELDISQYLSGNGTTWSPSSNIGVQVWKINHNDKGAWIARVAKSLSNELRSRNKVPMDEDTYQGQALLEEAYIKVSWAWITFPAATLVAVVLLFTANVIITSRSGVPVWSSGSIALVLAGIDQEIKEMAKGTYASYHQMTAAVGDFWVSLEGDKSGFSFVRTEGLCKDSSHKKHRG